MVRSVGVMDWTDSHRATLVQAIRDLGFPCRDIGDLDAWSGTYPFGIAVLALEEERMLDLVSLLRDRHPGVSPLCLVPEPSAGVFVAAIISGAETVLDYLTPAHHVAIAVEAVDRGLALVDVATLRRLVDISPDTSPPKLGHHELRLLRLIVAGAQISRIETELSCSRRTAYRRMHDLYAKLGARNREEAMYVAGRWGLLG
jgi:DNA-binding NarL/FixJ family response regulator